MKTYPQCLPCFIRQTHDALNLVTEDPAVQEHVLRRILAAAAAMDFNRPPPLMGAEIHRTLREATGNPDPYLDLKTSLTDFVLGLLPDLEWRVRNSPDPFDTALRLAIAGNIIDFSITDVVQTDRILETIDDTLEKPFARDDSQSLRKAADEAGSILYLADNAGEIVFDRLLLSVLPQERVTFVVKGSPVINDAVLSDAEQAGIPDLVKVIDNGTDIPGTWLPGCPPDFQKTFAQADLVISKGQGNYETLSNASREVYFLLRAKCATIEKDIGCRMGDVVVMRYVPEGKES